MKNAPGSKATESADGHPHSTATCSFVQHARRILVALAILDGLLVVIALLAVLLVAEVVR